MKGIKDVASETSLTYALRFSSLRLLLLWTEAVSQPLGISGNASGIQERAGEGTEEHRKGNPGAEKGQLTVMFIFIARSIATWQSLRLLRLRLAMTGWTYQRLSLSVFATETEPV
jgi:hypothetical protein